MAWLVRTSLIGPFGRNAGAIVATSECPLAAMIETEWCDVLMAVTLLHRRNRCAIYLLLERLLWPLLTLVHPDDFATLQRKEKENKDYLIFITNRDSINYPSKNHNMSILIWISSTLIFHQLIHYNQYLFPFLNHSHSINSQHSYPIINYSIQQISQICLLNQ